MKRALILTPLLLLFTGIIKAQDDQLPPPSSNPQQEETQLPEPTLRQRRLEELSKYIIEPNLIFSSAYGGVSVGGSFYLGHQLWKNLYGGGGITYFNTQFRNLEYSDATGTIHLTNAYWNTYGGGVFLQYNIWRGLFVRDRFEILHRDIADVYNATLDYNTQTGTYSVKIPQIQRTTPDMLLGVGYNLLEGRKFFLPLTLSYNVLNSLTSRYYAVYPEGWSIQFGILTVF